LRHVKKTYNNALAMLGASVMTGMTHASVFNIDIDSAHGTQINTATSLNAGSGTKLKEYL
jgi:hypothetical protein